MEAKMTVPDNGLDVETERKWVYNNSQVSLLAGWVDGGTAKWVKEYQEDTGLRIKMAKYNWDIITFMCLWDIFVERYIYITHLSFIVHIVLFLARLIFVTFSFYIRLNQSLPSVSPSLIFPVLLSSITAIRISYHIPGVDVPWFSAIGHMLSVIFNCLPITPEFH